MRSSIAVLAGLFLSATLMGCGASATIPKPPSDDKGGPPPGTSKDMVNVQQKLKAGQKAGGGMGPAAPPKK